MLCVRLFLPIEAAENQFILNSNNYGDETIAQLEIYFRWQPMQKLCYNSKIDASYQNSSHEIHLKRFADDGDDVDLSLGPIGTRALQKREDHTKYKISTQGSTKPRPEKIGERPYTKNKGPLLAANEGK
jgi:hypothetical protein